MTEFIYAVIKMSKHKTELTAKNSFNKKWFLFFPEARYLAFSFEQIESFALLKYLMQSVTPSIIAS